MAKGFSYIQLRPQEWQNCGMLTLGGEEPFAHPQLGQNAIVLSISAPQLAHLTMWFVGVLNNGVVPLFFGGVYPVFEADIFLTHATTNRTIPTIRSKSPT